MPRIRFTETVQYESEGRNAGPIYEEGSVHDFDDHFAERWLRRNVAQLDDGKAPRERSGDGLDDLTVAQLRDAAAKAEIDLGEATRKADILAAIRAAKAKPDDEAPGDDGLDAISDDALLDIVEAEEIDVGEASERDEIIAAIRAAREAKAIA